MLIHKNKGAHSNSVMLNQPFIQYPKTLNLTNNNSIQHQRVREQKKCMQLCNDNNFDRSYDRRANSCYGRYNEHKSSHQYNKVENRQVNIKNKNKIQQKAQKMNKTHQFPMQKQTYMQIQKYQQPITQYGIHKYQNTCKKLKSIQQLIQTSKQRSKRFLNQDAAQLRQQLWLKLQKMFRLLYQKGENFHEQVLNAATMNVGKPGTVTSQVQNSLIQYIREYQTLYNKNYMKKIKDRMLQKMQKYFNDVADKYGQRLFNFCTQNNSNQCSHQYYPDQVDQVQYRNAEQQLQKQLQQKYEKYLKNEHHYTTPATPSLPQMKNQQSTNQKQQQFQIFSTKIRQSRQKYKSVQTSHNDSFNFFNQEQDLQVDPYRINECSQKSLSQLQKQFTSQHTHTHRSNYYCNTTKNAGRSHQMFRQAKWTSRQNNINKKLKNNNSISISPVISRVKLNDDAQIQYNKNQKQNRNSKYSLGNSQQCLYTSWCQQVKLNSQIRTIYVQKTGQNIINSKTIISTISNLQRNSFIYGSLLCLTFCNQSTNLAVGSQNSLIYVYSIDKDKDKDKDNNKDKQNKLIAKLSGHSSAVCILFYDNLNNNGILFSGGDVGCCSIYLWCTKSWTMRSKLNIHNAAVTCILGIPNTDCIFSCSFDKSIQLYNYRKSEIVDSKQSKLAPYSKMVYYEHMQKIAIMTPTNIIQFYELILSKQKQKQKQLGHELKSQESISCGYRVSIIQKAGTNSNNILVVALANQTIELYKIPQKTLLKKIQFNKGGILGMITINRQIKSQYPIILCVCQSAKVIHQLNTQNQHISQINTKGNLNMMIGGGLGPIIAVNQNSQISWINQDAANPKMHISKFTIY